MRHFPSTLGARLLMATLGVGTLLCASTRGEAATLPASTTLPVVLTTSIEAGKARVNDPVWAKTMQVVLLPDGERIPKGAIVTGHIVASRAFAFDKSPYAKQIPSVLAVLFDKVTFKQTVYEAHLQTRALANVLEAEKAESPYRTDEADVPGVMMQIGGDHYDVGTEAIHSRFGDIVAYKRKEGTFARLIARDEAHGAANMRCDGTRDEQSVAIFSADACGLYGFDDAVSLTVADGSTVQLESTSHNAKLWANSALLLEESPTSVHPYSPEGADAVM